jgi:hypothetical protein
MGARPAPGHPLEYRRLAVNRLLRGLTHYRASAPDWSRLADPLEALDRGGEAAEARRGAAALGDARETER